MIEVARLREDVWVPVHGTLRYHDHDKELLTLTMRVDVSAGVTERTAIEADLPPGLLEESKLPVGATVVDTDSGQFYRVKEDSGGQR